EMNEFINKFGDVKKIQENETVIEELHSLLEPYMLRRMKEDVELSIPAKEETIIEVELTTIQKTFYRAILDKNRDFLCKGIKVKSNLPNLINVLMEIRKCCNHPYLTCGAEAK